jgi:hypothetical protein
LKETDIAIVDPDENCEAPKPKDMIALEVKKNFSNKINNNKLHNIFVNKRFFFYFSIIILLKKNVTKILCEMSIFNFEIIK